MNINVTKVEKEAKKIQVKFESIPDYVKQLFDNEQNFSVFPKGGK